MTTDLARYSAGTQITPFEEAILAEAAAEENAYDRILTRIKISPGGINQWVTSDGEAMKTFTGIIAISQKARAYWPDKGTGQAPLCTSPDGTHGILNPEPTAAQWQAAGTARNPHPALLILDSGSVPPPSFACATCPLSQFGTVHQGGTSGKGVACKSLRRLVVFVEGWAEAALLTLPPTSIRSLDTYASSLAQRRSAYFAVKTKFTLEAQKSGNGDPYSVATFAMAGPLDEADLAMVLNMRRRYESYVRAMPIDSAEYDTQATAAPVVQTGEPTDATGGPIPFGDDDPFEQATLIDAPAGKHKYN